MKTTRASGLALVCVMALVASACQIDPSGLGSLGVCDGVPATVGYGYNPDADPTGGAAYVGTGGADVAVILNGPVTYSAGGSADLICVNYVGTPEWDDVVTINGNAGNDTIYGGTSNDIINAGGGFDTVDGGAGVDDCINAESTNNCERIDGIPSINRIVIHPSKLAPNSDGWVQLTNGLKQWVDPACRSQLETSGMPVDLFDWPIINGITDIDVNDFVPCAELLNDTTDIWAVNAALGRGVNLGNLLEAPSEGEWGLNLDPAWFPLIAGAGFDHVRFPIRWNAYAAETAPYTVPTSNDPNVNHPDYDNVWQRVDQAVSLAEQNGLMIIIDFHHYYDLMDDPAGHEDRYLAIWDQVATHYAGASENVVFELLNEPEGAFITNPQLWNDLMADAVDVIRQTNPNRPILVGPVAYNDIQHLDVFDPPNDPNLITTVHMYEPFPFTHQGADWVEPALPSGISFDPAEIDMGAGWQNWSWETDTEPTQGGIVVTYDRAYAGFNLHRDQTIDPTSMTVEIDGPGQFRIVCYANGVDTEIANLAAANGVNFYNFNLNPCPAATEGVYFQNTTTDLSPVTFLNAEVCQASGCEQAISTRAEALQFLFDIAAAWSTANNMPMHVGEFGAYGANGLAPIADRAAWTATVQGLAIDRGFSTAYWEFGAGFGVYDPDLGQWNWPIRNALLN